MTFPTALCTTAGVTSSGNRWVSVNGLCSTTGCGSQVSSLGVDADGIPQRGSALIDSGDAAHASSTDHDGFARPFGSAPDAGAYEWLVR